MFNELVIFRQLPSSLAEAVRASRLAGAEPTGSATVPPADRFLSPLETLIASLAVYLTPLAISMARSCKLLGQEANVILVAFGIFGAVMPSTSEFAGWA